MNLQEFSKKFQRIGYKNILAALLIGIITIFITIIFNKNNNSHRTSCHSFTVEELTLDIIANNYMGGKLGDDFKNRNNYF